MSKLTDNIETLLRMRGWSQKQLAEASGISQPTLNRIMRGESKDPRYATIEPIAKLFDLTPEALKHHQLLSTPSGITKVPVAGFEIRGVDGDDGVDPSTDIMIDVVDVEASAGDGALVPEFVPTRYRLPFQIEWLRKWNARPEQVIVVPVRGDSMEDVLFHGDKATVHRGMTKVESGRTYLFLYGLEARIKKLFRTLDGGYRIVS